MKKLLLTLTTPILALSPIVAVVACGEKENNVPKDFQYETIEEVGIAIWYETYFAHSTVIKSELVKKTNWIVGADNIASELGIKMPPISSEIFIRAKYDTSYDYYEDDNTFSEIRFTIQISYESFPATGNPSYGKFTTDWIGFYSAKSEEDIEFGQYVQEFAKSSFEERRSTLTHAQMSKLSEEERLDWSSLGMPALPDNISIEIDWSQEGENVNAKAGAVFEKRLKIKSENKESDFIYYVIPTKDHEMDYSAIMSEIVGNSSGEIKVEKLPTWNKNKKITFKELLKNVEGLEALAEIYWELNWDGMELYFDSIKVIDKSASSIKIEIIWCSKKLPKNESVKWELTINTYDSDAVTTSAKNEIDNIFGNDIVRSSYEMSYIDSIDLSLVDESNFYSSLGLSYDYDISEVADEHNIYFEFDSKKTLGNKTGAEYEIAVIIIKGTSFKKSTITIQSSDYDNSSY